MTFSTEKLRQIYDRTDGRCHICQTKKLAWCNYGTLERRGSWEVDHSTPKAKGGTDRLSNLLPACVSCNRRKRDGSTCRARALHGHTRRPLSGDERQSAHNKNVLSGGAAGLAAGLLFAGPIGAAIGGLGGATLGYFLEVEA